MIQDTYHLAFNLNFAKAELFGHGDILEKHLTFFFFSLENLTFFFSFFFTIYNFIGNLEKGSLTSRLIFSFVAFPFDFFS